MSSVVVHESSLESSIFPMAPISSLVVERTEKVGESEFPALSVGKRGVTPQLDGVAKTQSAGDRKLVRAGDLVINSRSNRRGAAGLARQDGSVSLVYSVMTPNSDVLVAEYGHHILRSIAFQDEYFRWGTGIVDDLWSTNFTRMSRIHIPLPPPSIQRAIAGHLDEIDSMIQKLDDLTEMLHARRSGVLSVVLAPFFRGENVPIWSVLSPVKDQDHPREEVLSVYRDHGVVPKNSRDDNHNRTPEDLTSYQLVLPGDVVINKMKAWQGSLGVSGHQGIVSPDYQVARPADGVVPRYLHAVLRSPTMIPQYRARSIGVRPAQWRLYWTDFSSLKIPLPAVNEQQRIARHLDEVTGRIDGMLTKVAELRERLIERGSAYISDVVTGRKEVA